MAGAEAFFFAIELRYRLLIYTDHSFKEMNQEDVDVELEIRNRRLTKLDELEGSLKLNRKRVQSEAFNTLGLKNIVH